MNSCDHCNSKNLKRVEENVERFDPQTKKKRRVDVIKCQVCWKEKIEEHVARPRGAEEHSASTGTTEEMILSSAITPMERVVG